MRKRKSESGAAMVEFSLVIGFLLFFLVAVIDFCLLFYQRALLQAALSHAVQQAARTTAVTVLWSNLEDEIKNRANDYIAARSSLGLKPVGLEITPGCEDPKLTVDGKWKAHCLLCALSPKQIDLSGSAKALFERETDGNCASP